MMTTSELVRKFAQIELEVAKERGEFALFALFLREDAPGLWDLMVSAPWVADRNEALNYLVHKIKSDLGPGHLTQLSRIVFADSDNPGVESFNRSFHVEHGSVELKDCNVFGQDVKHAFIITSKRPEAPVAA